MAISIGVVGAGEFGHQFAELFKLHPGVREVYTTDLVPERARVVCEDLGLAGVVSDFDALLDSDVDAIAIFAQRWQHGPLAERALLAGKHVYSAVPMGITEQEIRAIVAAASSSAKVYMMGETSFYNPAAVYAREKVAAGEFGEVFYAEGDYVHDIDTFRGFKRSGGESWKALSSFPPMLYPTHAIGGVLSVLTSHAVSVSCIGVTDRGARSADGIFDRAVSRFDNDFSNATALFELSDGAVMRTNEMRRVGYPSRIRESRFRFFGTEGTFEQLAEVSAWHDHSSVTDVSDLLRTRKGAEGSGQPHYLSGYASVHEVDRLPAELRGARNGHEGAHHFLVDDFVRAVAGGSLPPVNAWQAARYTLPGVVAHQSSRSDGARLGVPDLGDAPVPVGTRLPDSVPTGSADPIV